MSEKLTCHVVKDLLPMYIDGLTSEETTKDIKEHLAGCEDCRAQHAAMTGQIPGGRELEEKEIDYLKKVKRRGKRAAVIVGCIAVLLLAILGVRFLVIGGVDEQLMISAEVEGTREVYISAQTASSSMAISGLDVSEKDGVITISARTVPIGILRKSSRFEMYTARSDIKQIVDASGKVIWENGTEISDYVGRMYARKVKYVGDASAVSDLVKNIDLPDLSIHLKPGIQLKTDAQPYGIILDCEDRGDLSRDHLIRHACLLLALVENLDYVEYRIEINQESYSAVKVTAQDALEKVKVLASAWPAEYKRADPVRNASGIKDFAKSAYDLQILTEALQMYIENDYRYYDGTVTNIPEVLSGLGLDYREGVVVAHSNVIYQTDECWHETIDFSNGDMLICSYEKDNTLISSSYLDRERKLLYQYYTGSSEVTVREVGKDWEIVAD